MDNSGELFCSIHNHTIFCDGQDDVESMCRAAYEKNLYSIGFSSHAPSEKQLGRELFWNMKEENINNYINEVHAAKERWQGKIKVFLGLEVDYVKGKRSPADNDIKSLNLDFIIGSVHHLCTGFKGQAICSGACAECNKHSDKLIIVDDSMEEFTRGLNDGYGKNAEKLMNSYYDAVLEMIDLGGFDILGHADILKKNTINRNLWPKDNEIKRQREVAEAVSKKDIVIEVNTGGINRKKINEVYPSLTFLRIIQEYNIPVVITADAHNINDINGNYNAAVETLKMADINKHYIFNGKSNNKTDWLIENIK